MGQSLLLHCGFGWKGVFHRDGWTVSGLRWKALESCFLGVVVTAKIVTDRENRNKYM